MTRRIAACMSLVAFALCILMGLQAGNPFTTVVSNALVALVVTFGVGLVIGAMAQKMLDENLAARTTAQDAAEAAAGKISANPEAKPGPGDR
jgi:hypothetical protein